MKYFSTRNKDKDQGVDLSYAVLKGLADDGGLYLPEIIHELPQSFFENIQNYSLPEIGFEAAKVLTGNVIPDNIMSEIIAETLNFPIPLVEVEKGIYSLELFHGPTLAFKDVGARFIARLMGYFVQKSNRELKVIAATSGDTGSAVAAGFYNIPGIHVYILYPQGKVSFLQEKQLTTWGGNISAIEVNGSFDDCQRLAKQLLSDETMNRKFTLTSANSINIARLIPQSFYYFWIYAKLKYFEKKIVVSVPCGNFGNLTGGLFAKKMGLPIERFVAATNQNDMVPQFLKTGDYKARPSVKTISNAMDVGNPSNFERMDAMFNGNLGEFNKQICGYSFSDEATKKTMLHVYQNTGYILDPHGAVAYQGLKEELSKQNNDVIGIFLETAHPAKFTEVVEPVLNISIEIPERLQTFAVKEKKSIVCENSIQNIKLIIQE